MLAAARKGPFKNMIWAWDQGTDPFDADDPYGAHKKALVNVYCYSRADTDNETEIKKAQDISSNMADQVYKLLVANKGSLTGAFRMEVPNRPRPIDNPDARPPYGCKVLQVEVLYVEP